MSSIELRARLYELAKSMLRAGSPEAAAKLVLETLLAEHDASRGFVVVKEGDSFAEKLDVRFNRDARTPDERRFSRSLVKEAVRTREVVISVDVGLDPRVLSSDSVQRLSGRSAMAVPLLEGEQTFAVVYLDRTEGFFADEPAAREAVNELADLSSVVMQRALEAAQLRRHAEELERALTAGKDFAGIITADPGMQAMLRTIAQVAASEITVLIRGETGTGKELVARSLHERSDRRAGPFRVVHCAALPASMLESELFGHEESAFTGATKQRPGRIAAAQGGTLFLDEIAEVPLDLQAKLLRFVQFGEVQRLGLDAPLQVDVRLVAATHRDLAELVRAGQFRADLYYRLNVVELVIPPLRERRDDIPLLIEHFLRVHAAKKREAPVLSPTARDILLAHDYPGNVRELEHLVQRCCALATSRVIGEEVLPQELRAKHVPRPRGDQFESLSRDELKRVKEAALADVERRFLEALMAKASNNVSRAARVSGLPRTYLQKLLARHGLRARR